MTDQAQQVIVGCLAGTVVVSAGSSLANGQAPSSRLLVGLGFTGLGLATASMFAPGLASGFAALMLVATTLTYGQPLLDYVATATAGGIPPAGGFTSGKRNRVMAAPAPSDPTQTGIAI